MTNLRASTVFPLPDLVQDRLAAIQADVRHLARRDAPKVEADIDSLRKQLDVLLRHVQKMDVVVACLNARFEVAIAIHERLAALEALADSPPPPPTHPGGNGRFRP